MPGFKILNILAIASLAVVVCSFGAAPTNALSTDLDVARHMARDHHAIAKKRRQSKRCKPRTSSAAAPKKTSSGSGAGQYGNNGNNGNNGYNGPAPSSGGSGKFGLAWPNGGSINLDQYKTGRMSHIYTWSPDAPPNDGGLTFIPMLWGANQIGDFQSRVKGGYANIAAGFNEPNEPGQSNLSPGAAASLWKQYLEPLRNEGYQLISPATSGNPNGLTWMHDFYNACGGGCTVDFTATHFYDTTSQKFIAWVNQWHDQFGHPMMVTEYACQNFNGPQQPSFDQVMQFHSEVINFCENTPWMIVCFPFGFMTDMQGVNPPNQLLDGNGNPTALGRMYLY